MKWYEIIMWRGAENSVSDFPVFCEQGFKTITLFNSLPEQFRPNFLRAISKKRAKAMTWDLENFRECLLKKRGGSLGGAPSELGYSIGFFSSMKDSEAFGYSLHIGDTNPMFVNSLIIRISPAFDMGDEQNAETMKKLFIQAVREFRPFWGCLKSESKAHLDVPKFENKAWHPVHWLNYYSPETIQQIEGLLEELLKDVPSAYWEDKILILPHDPLDDRD